MQLFPQKPGEDVQKAAGIGEDRAACEKHGETMTNTYEVGMLVRHPMKPEWGLGKVLTVEGDVLKIHFKNDRGQDYRAILTSMISLEIADETTDPALDNLPPFNGKAFVAAPKRVTFEEGLERFSQIFPLGFQDTAYLEQERNYKWDAHERFETELGGRARQLLDNGDLETLTSAAVSIASINLLSPYEMMAFGDALVANRSAAKAYFEALLDLTEQGLDKTRFERLASAVSDLPSEPGRARVATWPVLTVLPYLARPDAFMFLKPQPTKACAERLRFELQYGADLRWITYDRLMALSDLLFERLRPLGARDYIDVQSFMWVVAKY